jgi:YD repeat-containing protein
MTPRELIDVTLQKSGWGTLADIEANRWIDCQPDFATAHYLNGFGYADGKFRFKPNWPEVPFTRAHRTVTSPMPRLPDHWDVIEEADAEHPFRLATSPARGFLNSSFTETPTSLAKERRPEVMIHPDDAAPLAVADGDLVALGNRRGTVRIHARLFDGVRRGVLIAESLWPNKAYADGKGPAYSYSAAGRLKSRVWARGITTTNVYDNAGGLIAHCHFAASRRRPGGAAHRSAAASSAALASTHAVPSAVSTRFQNGARVFR